MRCVVGTPLCGSGQRSALSLPSRRFWFAFVRRFCEEEGKTDLNKGGKYEN
jgi:hypothetical protein